MTLDAAVTDPRVRVESVSKTFAKQKVLDDISLSVKPGEFVTLLGPSGCGKSTLLRIIAGFEAPDAGRVLIDGEDVTSLQANKRPVNLVFQRVALFPHLDVFQNIEFGLSLKRTPRKEVARKVREVLELVGMAEFERRRPETLSGGQAQRIALARALVNDPRVLLLDEPLSALDLQIRRQLQGELKSIHRELGGTFIFVTHDQEEAMAMSDRIVLMSGGRISQQGSPVDVYRNPSSVDVAKFVGSANVVSTRIEAVQGDLATARGDSFLSSLPGSGLRTGDEVSLVLRSETITLDPCPSGGCEDIGVNTLESTVIDRQFVGPFVNYEVERGSVRLTVSKPSSSALLQEGQVVHASWTADSIVAFPK